MHDTPGSFVTLTYDNDHLPWDGSVSKREHQLFIKRLRKEIGKPIRYYMCGEYGADETESVQMPNGNFKEHRLGPGRPHYHYLIFGFNFSEDRYEWTNHRGHQYYRSPTLEKVWTKGMSTIGHVTPETAAYTARYVLKKQTGNEKEETHYSRVLPGREELVFIEPEFALMSLKPGIGSKWFEKYGRSDIYDSGDFVVINGKKYATPKYYDKLFEDLDERELLNVRNARRSRAHLLAKDQTRDRLATREELATIRSTKLKRGLENGST